MSEKIIFALKELDKLMEKVSRVHGNMHPELIKINLNYKELRNAIYENDYLKARTILDDIKKDSSDFKLPEDACEAYTRVYEAFKILNIEII